MYYTHTIAQLLWPFHTYHAITHQHISTDKKHGLSREISISISFCDINNFKKEVICDFPNYIYNVNINLNSTLTLNSTSVELS